MKVVVSVHGRFHAFELAKGLYRRGMLNCLQTTYPASVTRRIIGHDIPMRTAPWLEVWRRIYPKLRLGPQPDLDIARSFGRFAARSLRGSTADLLVGWSSATLEAIGPAQDSGMKVIIERGSSHIAYQCEILRDEYQRHGNQFMVTDPGIIEREIREYELADAIVVPSSFAAKTFVDRGVAKDKIFVTTLGVDSDRFKPAGPKTRAHAPRILFVGSLGLRKGTPLLLRAFSNIKEKAELYLVGPIESNFKPVLAKLPLDNVVIPGPASGQALLKHYTDADIFCLPSLEEGFGMVALEAMAGGLPVVISDVAGAAEAISPGQTGLVFPSGDEGALTDALEELVADPEKRIAMGAAARERVVTGYQWDDYVDRAVAVYNNVLA